MNLRKFFTLLLAALLTLTLFAGCATEDDKNSGTEDQNTTSEQSTEEDEVSIRIGGLAGPTSMGLVKVMEDNATGNAAGKYEFTVAASPDILTPKLVQGQLDIAALPANLASILYGNTDGKVQLLAINTLGVVYILAKNVDINSISDLKGKTIYASGKGATPEFSLRYILTENGINPDTDLNLEWKSEHSEIVATLNSMESGIAMIPQPFVTIAQKSVENLEVVLDLTEEWDKIGNGTQLLTGVLVVRREFAVAHPGALATFLDEYSASVSYVNANVAEAAALIDKHGIFNAAVAKEAIPHCNITFIAGSDMKPLMDGYLRVLHEQLPASVGGKLPDDKFYYEN